MRVAIRRIRSILKAFRPLLAVAQAHSLEPRLRDLGVQLGVARDSEVLLQRLFGFLDELPETFVLGPVRRRLREQLHGEYLQGRTAALSFMESAAYAELLEDVIAFVHGGFAGDIGEQPAGKVLAKMARRSCREVVRRVAAAEGAKRRATSATTPCTRFAKQPSKRATLPKRC